MSDPRVHLVPLVHLVLRANVVRSDLKDILVSLEPKVLAEKWDLLVATGLLDLLVPLVPVVCQDLVVERDPLVIPVRKVLQVAMVKLVQLVFKVKRVRKGLQ